MIQQTSIFVPSHEHQLHLRVLEPEQAEIKGNILFLHGVLENGLIFYTESNKGLAPYLCQQGYRCLIMDMRGRGKSQPSLTQNSDHGQNDYIAHDLPRVARYIAQHYDEPQHWVAHSWGGVLMSSTMARFTDVAQMVRSQTFFGTKRTIRVRSFEKWFKIDLFWNFVARKIARKSGVLDAVKMNMGSENESYQFLVECGRWIVEEQWIDAVDRFDYGAAALNASMPPTWFIAAVNDRVLGNPSDVQDFMTETANQNAKYSLLGKQNGNQHDYDHVNMLTHKLAVDDHFPQVLEWLNQHD
ncbi:alpha/beta fold hydrolase [Pleionea sp. CnH1-48]|uniref:alpha/beta fold hydrolase n=1 Tax=Pleionea sp. CnH1-48 TaxID=2954494 RepID=UPI0020985A94|nr:alpha/beta fold hydrolase [Pleionea sp. CnH1-48]MCO7224281.1 alpha/beta hydrolase [Pleionea sp. CnH1-48]